MGANWTGHARRATPALPSLVGALAGALAVIACLLATWPSGAHAAAVGPVLGKTIEVAPVSGHVFVKLPRSTGYVALVHRRVIPVGSAVNTSHGAVDLASQRASRAGVQKGTFNGAAFIVTQPRDGETDLGLIGGRPRSVCRIASGTGASAAAAAPKVLRTLHAKAHGRFKTTGTYAAASIRGTVWTTSDTCAGTAISDARDRVQTRANDFPLSFPLAPGETVTYHCNAHGIRGVSREYCVLVVGTFQTVGSKHFALFITGLGTLGTPASDMNSQLCVRPPGGRATRCAPYPLSPPDTTGLQFSTVQCPPDQGPGSYAVTVRIGGVELTPPLTYRAPNVNFERGRCTAELGQNAPGTRTAPLAANTKRVNAYTLPTGAVVPWMYADLAATGTRGAEQVRGIVYADSNGVPGALVGATTPITIRPTSPPSAYRMYFAKAVHLTAGKYWIGVLTGGDSGVAAIRYFPLAQSAPTNANVYSSGPSDPFGPLSSVENARLSVSLFYANPDRGAV